MDINAENVVGYLREKGRVSAAGEVLVQDLSGSDGPARSVVLKIFDVAAGEKVGSDLRSEAQKKAGKTDVRMSAGACFVVKQAMGAEDGTRVQTEKACMELLAGLLPEGSVPAVLWEEEGDHVVAMSCPPAAAMTWKKELASGVTTMEAAVHAGMVLAMLHSSTKGEAAVKERFGDGRLFSAARLEPGILAAIGKNAALGKMMQDAVFRAKMPMCLIHGDFVPGNILLVPRAVAAGEAVAGGKEFELSSLMLVDFDAATYGHPGFDVASLLAELLLMGFIRGGRWRAMMMLADNFWQTYRQTADPDMARAAGVAGGRLLAALLLARVDGTRPVGGLGDTRGAAERVRKLAKEIMMKNNISLDEAIDAASMHYEDG